MTHISSGRTGNIKVVLTGIRVLDTHAIIDVIAISSSEKAQHLQHGLEWDLSSRFLPYERLINFVRNHDGRKQRGRGKPLTNLSYRIVSLLSKSQGLGITNKKHL